MRCQRCNGFVITEQVPADTIILDMLHCINCGHLEEIGHIPIDKEPSPQGRKPSTQCTNCKRERAPGYTQCEPCRKVQRDYRKKNPDRRHWPSVKRGQSQRRDQGPVWI